jgi:hypothetical protein
VRVNIPPNAGKDDKVNVRIGLAGEREQIAAAKDIIREITTYYHSDVTHPGLTHAALDIPSRMFNAIIGSRGSEIKHIQNNFKVAVHIPNPNSLTQMVIVVGRPSDVDSAVRYIQKITSQIVTEEATAASVAQTWNEQNASNGEEGEDPEWMAQYMYNRDASKTVNLLGAAAPVVTVAAAESAAWRSADAEGW